MLHCGLHAINALLLTANYPSESAETLDKITSRIYQTEREICSDGIDTKPDARGNYPIETLLFVLNQAGLKFKFIVMGQSFQIPQRTIGFLIATGNHYAAIVQHKNKDQWRIIDNGNVVAHFHRTEFLWRVVRAKYNTVATLLVVYESKKLKKEKENQKDEDDNNH